MIYSVKNNGVRMGFRYIGAKTKIIPEIMKKVKSTIENGGHVADMMCGTGAVSASLRKEGFTVTAVDVMSQSYHHTRVCLLLNSPPKFEMCQEFIENLKLPQITLKPVSSYLKIISYLNNIEPVKGYFWREFSPDGEPENTKNPRKYFTSENAAKIDAIRLFIRQLKEENKISDLEHSLLIHDLIMATNDVANIAGTYGHYLSKFVPRAKQSIKFTPTTFLREGSTKNHEVILGYAEDVCKDISCDLCYIDPPYMKRQYAANYHILETLAREDEPEAIGVSGLRPWRDQYSDFCSKVKIRSAFEKILTGTNCNKFLISYSEDGLLKRHELEEFFSKFGKVEISSFMNKRFRSNDSGLDPFLREYLILVKI
jgi:adenine-specific DNA-methyltransferase